MRNKQHSLHQWLRKPMAFLLAVGMLMQTAAWNGVYAEAAANTPVSDTSTLESYKDSLGDNESTRYSGRIWTDKTVSTEDIHLTGTVDGKEVNYDIPKGADDFLVAFSALATGTQVYQETPAPVDVVFVLDLSASMISMKMDGDRSRLAVLVDALNNSLATLLQGTQNQNRVAVVGYRTNSQTDILVPLGDYNSVNFELSNPNQVSSGTVTITASYQQSNGTTDSSVTTLSTSENGGTNIQTGIYDGMNLLATASDTSVTIGDKTVTRVPYVILMSDGVATHSSAAPYYWEPRVDGAEVNYGLGGNWNFVGHSIKAMMTAAYMKQQIDKRYGLSDETASYKTKIFTFGFGLDGDPIATATMDPKTAFAGTNLDPKVQEMKEAADKYITGSNVPVNTGVRFRFHRVTEGGKVAIEGGDVGAWRQEATADNSNIGVQTDTGHTNVPTLGGGDPGSLFTNNDYYTYYQTGGTGVESNGFSEKTPVLVTVDNTANKETGLWSGYAYFDDYAYTLTHPNAVDEITDIYYNDNYIAANSASDVTQAFDKIVSDINLSTIKVPTKVDGKPETSGYITYTDPIGDYMKVTSIKEILWAGLEFTDSTHTLEVDAEGNKITTYTFTGTIDSPIYGEKNLSDIIIQVAEDSQGKQTLTIRIPASAIPMRVNTVTLSDNGTTVQSNVNNNAYPIRVFYGVTRQDGVITSNGNVNTALVSQDYIKQNTQADGSVAFYSNAYSASAQGYPEKTIGDATATFTPSSENPFYFTQEDILLYTDDSCTAKATTFYPTATYYFKIQYYEGTDIQTAIIERSGELLTNATKVDGGSLYLRAGMPRLGYLTEFVNDKPPLENATGTASTSYYPTFEYGSDGSIANGQFKVYLGNNGKLSAGSSSNLKISKIVTGENAPENQGFTFNVTVTDSNNAPVDGTFNTDKTKSDGTVETVTLDANGKTSVTLKAGESLTILELPPAVMYTVEETPVPPGFTPSVAGADMLDQNNSAKVTGTIDANTTENLTYTNTFDGDAQVSLTGTKTLEGRNITATDNFTFTLAANNDAARNAITDGTIEMPNPLTADAGTDGNFTFGTITFKAEGTYEFKIEEQLPEGVTKEDPVSEGIHYDTHATIVTVNVTRDTTTGILNTAVTYDNGNNAETGKATFTNKFENLVISKTVTGSMGDRDKLFDFTITLEDQNGDAVTGTYQCVGGTLDSTTVEAPTISTLTFDEQGSATMRLKHGQTITLVGLPVGTTYTVTEPYAQADGYTVTVNGTASSNGSGTITGGTAAENVAFTNNREPTVPTGIMVDSFPWMLAAGFCLLGVAALAFSWGYRRRLGHHHEN